MKMHMQNCTVELIAPADASRDATGPAGDPGNDG